MRVYLLFVGSRSIYHLYPYTQLRRILPIYERACLYFLCEP